MLSDPDFKSKLQNHIKEIEIKLEPHSNPHIKWEFMKYEVRKFSISYSKSKYQLENSQRIYHENIVKRFSSTLDTPSEGEFAESKDFLDQFFGIGIGTVTIAWSWPILSVHRTLCLDIVASCQTLIGVCLPILATDWSQVPGQHEL